MRHAGALAPHHLTAHDTMSPSPIFPAALTPNPFRACVQGAIQGAGQQPQPQTWGGQWGWVGAGGTVGAAVAVNPAGGRRDFSALLPPGQGALGRRVGYLPLRHQGARAFNARLGLYVLPPCCCCRCIPGTDTHAHTGPPPPQVPTQRDWSGLGAIPAPVPSPSHPSATGAWASSSLSASASGISPLPRPIQHMGYGEVPRRVCLLPNVHPRAIAVLSSTGTLYRCVCVCV